MKKKKTTYILRNFEASMEAAVNHNFIFQFVSFVKVGGTCGIMIIIVGNRPRSLSSNPAPGCLYFT